jgi:hypothetical protein
VAEPAQLPQAILGCSDLLQRQHVAARG